MRKLETHPRAVYHCPIGPEPDDKPTYRDFQTMATTTSQQNLSASGLGDDQADLEDLQGQAGDWPGASANAA